MGDTRPLKVLVVEDRDENVKAAQKYFDTREDTCVDYVSNYREGLRLLREEEYDVALLDFGLPREAGGGPEEIGFGLADEAERQAVPWAVITAGIDHHQCEAAFVIFFWDQERKPHEVTETPKNSPEAWRKIYETLMNPFKGESMPIYWALKRLNPKNPIQVLLTPLGAMTRKYLVSLGVETPRD